MINILSSLSKTVISSFILLLAIIVLLLFQNFILIIHILLLFRWFHVLSGVMWIGLYGISTLFKSQVCQIFQMTKNQQFQRL